MKLADVAATLRDGGRLARTTWPADRLIRQEYRADGIIDLAGGLPMRWQPTVEDMLADDWRVLEEPGA